MRRADRLFQIVQYLRQRKITTALWLSEKLEVSERTIYRDIQDLMCSGVPIESEAGVGYILRHGFDIPPIMFTQEEIEALVISARMAKTWAGPKLAKSTEFALDKIEAVLPDHLKEELNKPRVFSPDIRFNEPPSNFIDDIREAINAKQMIQIQYHSLKNEISTRTIKPLGLFFWGKVWTLASWCELRQSYRSFRIDRINAIKILDEGFTEGDCISFDNFMEVCFGGALKGFIV